MKTALRFLHHFHRLTLDNATTPVTQTTHHPNNHDRRSPEPRGRRLLRLHPGRPLVVVREVGQDWIGWRRSGIKTASRRRRAVREVPHRRRIDSAGLSQVRSRLSRSGHRCRGWCRITGGCGRRIPSARWAWARPLRTCGLNDVQDRESQDEGQKSSS